MSAHPSVTEDAMACRVVPAGFRSLALRERQSSELDNGLRNPDLTGRRAATMCDS